MSRCYNDHTSASRGRMVSASILDKDFIGEHFAQYKRRYLTMSKKNSMKKYFTEMLVEYGKVLEMEGRIPEMGFKCSYKEFTFEIVESDNKHIIKIKVIRKDENI